MFHFRRIAWFLVLCLFLSTMVSLPAALAGSDTLTAEDCNYPTALAEGKAFSLRGIIRSESSKIVRLEAGVYNGSGKMLTGRSWNPNAKSVDLRWYVNPYVKFGTLEDGTYTYKITATNGTAKETLVSADFVVTPAPAVADALKSSGLTYPTALTKGKGFSLRGVVYSQNSMITKLTAGVFDGDKMLTGRSWNPKAKTVDFRWYVNPFVKFGTLNAGTYTYKVVAVNAAGTETLLSQDFTVAAPDPAEDGLKASGLNYPTTVTGGKGFSLRGVVYSQNSKITKLTAGVFDGDNMLTGRSWNPKAKSVDFRWYVNPFVKFGTLNAGTYTYKVVAVNAAGTETLLSQDFSVTAPEPASDKLKSSGLSAPTLLIEGRGFGLRGVVSSESSKISNITAGVFDGDGKMLTGRNWNPKANSVDFRWYVDKYVKFGGLAAGTYTYKVTATNAAGTATLLENTFEVVK